MNCPFNKDSLDKLKLFINFCHKQPAIVQLPELKFFKDYLESVGATIPSSDSINSNIPGMEQTKVPEHEAEPEIIEEVESEPESELEFDMEGCVEPDVVGPDHFMGDASKIPNEDDIKNAYEKRMDAMSEFAEGNFEKSASFLTEAIAFNPISAVLFVKRGQCFLKLNKPNACIKDCTRALELNPDSAAGFRLRGRAHRLLADWENAAKDLRQACTIDFDEQTDEWLKEVTPNAHKIEQHRLKQERKKSAKEEKERVERIRKMKEPPGKTEEESAEPETKEPHVTAGMGDFYKFFQDPEILTAFKDPEVAAAFQDISVNPANFSKYQSNPKIMAVVTKLSTKFVGSGFPSVIPEAYAGNFPGAPPPPPPAAAGGASSTTEDDRLD